MRRSERGTPCPRPLLVQALIFPKSAFDAWDVFAWLDEYGYRPELEETGSSYRARQHPPDAFLPGSFRTIAMGRGQSHVKAVVGCPKPWLTSRVTRERSRSRKKRR